MIGVEQAIGRTLRWLLPALAVTPLLLLIPTPHGSTLGVLAHLTGLVIFGLALTMSLATDIKEDWFPGLKPVSRVLASLTTVVVLATGAVALVTLASSAALRFDPSLQFLQLLSALDIAWAAGATAVGAQLLRNRTIGWTAGFAVVAICIWSVASYLVAVGYTPTGGWKVDGAAMWRYILPFDMAAAALAITAPALGARRAAARTPA